MPSNSYLTDSMFSNKPLQHFFKFQNLIKIFGPPVGVIQIYLKYIFCAIFSQKCHAVSHKKFDSFGGAYLNHKPASSSYKPATLSYKAAS